MENVMNNKIEMANYDNKSFGELVSIVVACYNGERYVDGCMRSLVCQTYQNIEILVCDDASTDKSLYFLRQWEKKDNRIKVLHNEKNLNIAATRNRCLKEAKGLFVAIQDIDDVSDSRRIELLVQSLKDSNVDFVSSSVGAFSKKWQDIDKVFSYKKIIPSKWAFLIGVPFFHPATMFSSSCLNAVKGYRVAKETRRAEDYDLFMRLYAAGYKGMCLPNILYYYRLDEGNYRRRTFTARKDEMTVRLQGFKALGLLPWGVPFVIKPLLAHVVMHAKLLISKPRNN